MLLAKMQILAMARNIFGIILIRHINSGNKKERPRSRRGGIPKQLVLNVTSIKNLWLLCKGGEV